MLIQVYGVSLCIEVSEAEHNTALFSLEESVNPLYELLSKT